LEIKDCKSIERPYDCEPPVSFIVPLHGKNRGQGLRISRA